MTGSLAERRIVITGGSGGIGREIAMLCATEGARLLINDRGTDIEGNGHDPKPASQLAAEISAGGQVALSDVRDVSVEGEAEALVARARTELGGIDALIVAHGLFADRSILKSDPAWVRRVLSVQLESAFSLVRAAADAMIEQKRGGAIVLFSSPSAFFGVRGHGALAAAAAGIVALARTAALELRRHDIRVNVVAPTARTRQTESSATFQSIKPDSMAPAHVAPIAAFLASPLAADIHGEVVGIAGARAYALRSRESTGAFGDRRPLTVEEVHSAWRDISRA